MTKRGIAADTAAKTDLLNVKRHVTGLSTFIRTCDTPLTIAVQGGWGTGKTTVLGMVAEQFASDSRVRVVDVDVWQVAFAAREEDIVIEVVTWIAASLASSIEADAALDETAKADFRARVAHFISVVRQVAPTQVQTARALIEGGMGALVDPAAGAVAIATQMAKDVSGNVREYADRKEPDPAESLLGEIPTGATVSRLFRDLVRARFGSGDAGDPDRLVVFIDNLDRLRPQRAVEVMECLKAILDAPHSVFVVAIDFDVVAEGIKEKYPTLGQEKARAFFDKIIQLPFQLPVSSYEIQGLVESLVPEIAAESDASVGLLRKAISSSVGANPRSIKRMVNSYRLLNIIIRGNAVASPFDLGLMALIALQTAYPDVYQYLDGEELVPLVRAVEGIRDKTAAGEPAENDDVSEVAREAAEEWIQDTGLSVTPTGGSHDLSAGGDSERRMSHVNRALEQRRVDDLANLIEVFAEAFGGHEGSQALRKTWQLAATTATDMTGPASRAQPLSHGEIMGRLEEMGQGRRKAWVGDVMQVLDEEFSGHGCELRSTLASGDNSLRLSMNTPGRGRPRLLALIYFSSNGVRVEVKEKHLTAASGAGLQRMAQLPGWDGHRSEKYEHFVLEAKEPDGAAAFASILSGLVDYGTTTNS